MLDHQLNAIERRVLETPADQPLPDFGRAPVLELIAEVRRLRLELARPQTSLVSSLARLSILNPALHPGLPFQLEQIHAALKAIRSKENP